MYLQDSITGRHEDDDKYSSSSLPATPSEPSWRKNPNEGTVWVTKNGMNSEQTTYVANKIAWVPPKNNTVKPSKEKRDFKFHACRIFKKLFLPLLLLLYTFLGGVIFWHLEGPYEEFELTQKEYHLNRTAQILCRDRPNDTRACRRAIRNSLDELEAEFKFFVRYGFQNHTYKHWSYIGAVFFSSTVYTGIGYGNQVPETLAGKYATIIYAVIGIPFLLNVLVELADMMNYVFSIIYGYGCHAILAIFMKSRYEEYHTKNNADFHLCCPMPTWFGMFMGFMYLVVGGCAFILIEAEWSFFDAFYFCFQTLSTIGFGDITPRSDYYVLFSFLYIVVGLAFMSMCTRVMQRGMHRLKEQCFSWQRKPMGKVARGDKVAAADASSTAPEKKGYK